MNYFYNQKEYSETETCILESSNGSYCQLQENTIVATYHYFDFFDYVVFSFNYNFLFID